MTGKNDGESMIARILVVEDELLVGNAMAHMLRTVGYRVDLAGNGQEALDKVAANCYVLDPAITSAGYDLVISDVRMPVMDGLALYDRLSRLYPDLSARVVFCTGDLGNPSVQSFLSGCGARVLRKPFCLRSLLDVVAAALAEHCTQVPLVSSLGAPA